MPHLKDGSEVKPGDVVRGPNVMAGSAREGVVVAVTPGARTCNVQLAYAMLLPPPQPGGLPVVTLGMAWANADQLERVT